jgi:cyclophilin family peptidyl-prolyl cis-trans isomerase
MILAPTKSSARRLATVGLVMLLAGCSVPTVSPTPSSSPMPTVAPLAPSFTLGPTISPSPFGCPTSAPAAFSGTATVTMTTTFGNLVIKVDSALGANAAGAFIALSRCGYYNNIFFHRVVPTFVIQAGDGTYARWPNLNYEKMGSGGPSWTIPDDKVTTAYKKGTLAMANTGNPNSGSSQFFIVLSDTAFAAGTTSYAIFGTVTSGLDVIDKIAAVPLGGEPVIDSSGNVTMPASMPLEPVIITSTIVATP